MIYFFLSGAAALIYEVLWLRHLGFVFGNTTFAVSTVLAAYMAGLGFGSHLLGRFLDRARRPLLIYGILEILIGIYASLTPLLMRFIQSGYAGFARAFLDDFVLLTAVRLGLSFLVVFVPTFFMGGTLPALTKFVVRNRQMIGSGTASLYGANTAGAFTGTVLAGFLLLPALGLRASLAIAVLMNLTIGVLACVLSLRVERSPEFAEETSPVLPLENAGVQAVESAFSGDGRSRLAWLVVGVFISGANAMILEVAWTRSLAAVMGSSTYAFTVMLATFLGGLALGSVVCRKILARREATYFDFGELQGVIAITSLVGILLLPWVDLLTTRLYAATLGHPNLLQGLLFLVCAVLMVGPAFCLGAFFPVSSALFIESTRVLSRKIGTLYWVNTLGNITGSLGAGFVLIPLVGIHTTLVATGVLALVLTAGCAAFMGMSARQRRTLSLAALSALILTVWIGQRSWNPILMTAGTHIHPQRFVTMKTTDILSSLLDYEVLFYEEGLHSIVSVWQTGQTRFLKVNGKTDASTEVDQRTQVFLAHLPLLLHERPREVCVIGFGSGSTLASVLRHSGTRVDCVEIEQAVLKAAPYFREVNRGAYLDPRARLIVNDGRNHLLVEEKKYDVILSEPSNPWMAGVSNLFTAEFYRLVKNRLSDRGIFCQWLQYYSLDRLDLRMVMATVRSVFPHVTLWMSKPGDFLLIATPDAVEYDLDRIQDRIEKTPGLKQDLEALNVHGAAGLLSLFELGESDLKRLTEGSWLNTDDNLLLEFNAPRSLHEETAKPNIDFIRRFQKDPLPPVRSQVVSILESPDHLSDLGQGFFENQDGRRSRRYLKLAHSLDAHHAGALVGLGRLHLKSGELLKAVKRFRKAGSAEAFRYLGEAYLAAGEPAKAAGAFRRATSLNEADWKSHFQIGMIEERKGRYSEARTAFEQALEIRPNHLPLQVAEARALRKAGEATGSLELLIKLEERCKSYPPVYKELKETYLALGRLHDAVHLYEGWVRRNPYSSAGWETLAGLYRRQGNLQKARTAFRRFKELT